MCVRQQQVIRVYSLPDGTFSSDEEEEEEEEEEDEEEEGGEMKTNIQSFLEASTGDSLNA